MAQIVPPLSASSLRRHALPWCAIVCALAGLPACGEAPPEDAADASGRDAAIVDAGGEPDAGESDGGGSDGGGAIVPLPDDGGPLRLVFLSPVPDTEFTCEDDADGRLPGFGPIPIVLQVVNDPARSVARVVCQSSGGFAGYTYQDVVDEAGARIARVDHRTGYSEGEGVVIGLRCEALAADATTKITTAEITILETIVICEDDDGFACGGC